MGNRTRLIYPNGQVVTYTYDSGNRLDSVTDWQAGLYDYSYDQANRLDSLSLPNGVNSTYDYDGAGRLVLLSHSSPTETLASYAYGLDPVGNRTLLTETLIVPNATVPGAFLEENGQVSLEAESATQITASAPYTWALLTSLSGYTGTGYLQALPETGRLYPVDDLSSSPQASYPLVFSQPGTYTLWCQFSGDNDP